MSDPYLIPGTFVLKNRLGIVDPEKLQLAENEKTKLRSLEFITSDRNVQISMQSMKTIHKFLFRDVYDWAGQYRTIYISKENNRGITRFLPHERIVSDGAKAMDHLKSVFRHVNTDSIEKIVSALADVYLELNHIHPFREGNGRTQKLFFRNVAKQNGIVLNWRLVSNAEHIDAAIQGGRGNPSVMRDQFQVMGSRIDRSKAPAPTPMR
jgi:cell filamentation protein